tara:strand:- start:86 stop:1564 length:1479 start_codon:yes stop_codon:yes gene_type:complete
MGAASKLVTGIMSEFGERLGHKIFGEVIPETVQPMFKEGVGGISKVDADIFSRSLDFDPEVREPLDALFRNASEGSDEAYMLLDQTARNFELEDSALRVRSKAQKNLTQQQGLVPQKPPENIINNFTVSEKNLAPGIEGADLASEITEATEIHRGFEAFQQSGKKLGEKELSIGSTIGSIDQKKSFNLSPIEKAEGVPRAVGGTNIKETPGKRGVRREISSEIEDIPYKELHHIFGKAPGEKIISNAWRLIEAGKATVDDLINLNHWAKHYSVGLGDYGAEAVNRVPHSRTHSRSRAFKREMSAKEIKEIPEFDNIDDLTSYFREQLETRTIPMRGELDIQQGIYDLLPNKTKIAVEQLKVAKEKASRSLTDRYKKIYGETMPDTPPEVKDAYQTHIWIQKYLDVTDDRLIELAEELDQARLAQDMQMTKVVTQLEKLEAEELASLDRKAITTGRPGKQTSARAQEKIDYSQVRDETDPYEMLTGNESFWGK